MPTAPLDLEPLNLSFERNEPGWERLGPVEYRSGTSGSAARTGQRGASIRLDVEVDSYVASGGVLRRSIPAEPLRGKLVRLSAWTRTDDVKGQAGLWLAAHQREERNVLAHGSIRGHGPGGTTDWTRYEVLVRVAARATEVAIGLELDGGGEAMFDDLDLRTEPDPGDAPARLEAQVLAADGRPAANVLVAAVRFRGAVAALTRTDAGGHAVLEVPAGTYALSAASDAGEVAT